MNALFRFTLTLTILSIAGCFGTLHAQNCIEIERILVDACDGGGSPEGNNEMFRFRVGANAISIGDISIVNGWPSQGVNSIPWNGFVQNATTAAKTAELNATIVNACGYLVEPPGGVLPPNRSVLAVTSYSPSATLNSFADLTDTLFILFHDQASQTGGHFLNYNTGTPQAQTLRIQVDGAFPCYEEVTYERGSLVTPAGTPGAQNGAYVDFAPDGTPTYGNSGCQAPFEPFSAEWTNPGPLCSTNSPIDLNTLITGTTGGTWSGQGVNGSVFDPAQVSGPADVTYTVVPTNNCNPTPAVVTQTINVIQSADASFTNPELVCGSAGTLNLNSLVTGSQGGTWSGSGISNGILNLSSFNGDVTVTYTVGSANCIDSESQTFTVVNLSTPVVNGQTVFCNGETPTALVATADAGATTQWFADSQLSLLLQSGDSFSPLANQTTSYWVNQTQDGCVSDSVAVPVEFSVVNVPLADTLVEYCEGEPVPTLSASGANLHWYDNTSLINPLGNGNTLNPPVSSGSFYVTATEGSCESAPLEVRLKLNTLVSANILPSDTSLCSGEPISLISADASLNTWSTGSDASTISVSEPGWYILTREGACNSASDSVLIAGIPVSADFSLDQDTGYTVFPVMVSSLSTGSESCVWYLNDSVLVDFSAPGMLTFADSGTYVLKQICTNSSGCIDSTEQVIKVLSDKLLIEVPNVFSPNGDGVNDLFKVKYNAVKTFEARVFNRWGDFLYSWTDVASGWDGSTSGKDMNDGTYFFVINGTDIKDVAFEKKGFVMLIRGN
jgi:gliding motility-associated-like protein